MIRYNTVDDMWYNALTHILMGAHVLESRDGPCYEIIGYHGILEDPTCSYLNGRNISPYYANAEVLWYLSATTSIKHILPFAPQYERFADRNKLAYGAYGPRIMSALPAVLKILRESPNTRQAVLTLWEPRDIGFALSGDVKDIPCTCSWKFYVRDNRLHMVADMRSQDIWLGMPYDIYVNTRFQTLIAGILGCGLGTYTHQCGSLHLYERNRKAALKAKLITDPYYPRIQPEPTSLMQMIDAGRLFERGQMCSDNTLLAEMLAVTAGNVPFYWKEIIDDYSRRRRLSRKDNVRKESSEASRSDLPAS